ncbi:MAG: class I SAM-dependent methyltransferase [Planctomycetes bacterium]|nr:class I SAM-dependent methyltransferase [Planctomycetota bacterium]
MSRSLDPTSQGPPDWDALYRRGTPPWETGRPAGELVRVIDEGLVRPCRMLEMGCGSGADAAFLARRGFEITAVESAPIALERARLHAEQEEAQVRFVLGDVFDFAKNAGSFDFIYDAGFYHCVRRWDLDRLLDLLWRVTRPGSLYLTLAGSTEETGEGGPPRVSEQEIRGELGRLLEFVHLRPFRFESPERPEGYLGWSCLLRRPTGKT